MAGLTPQTRARMKALLERQGIRPDPVFGDYQSYIEKAQSKYRTVVLHADRVPPRGSVHLMLGRIVDIRKIWKRKKG